MIEIEATCTTCGHVFTPSHDAYVRGDWRVCTRCRDGPDDEVSGVLQGDPSGSQGNTALRYGQVEAKDMNSD